MQYTISPIIKIVSFGQFQTDVLKDGIHILSTIDFNEKESRLKAIKLALLLASIETEKNYRLSLK